MKFSIINAASRKLCEIEVVNVRPYEGCWALTLRSSYTIFVAYIESGADGENFAGFVR